MTSLKFQCITVNLLHLHPPDLSMAKTCYRPVAELIYKHSFSPATISDWNTLPREVIESGSLQSFKQLYIVIKL